MMRLRSGGKDRLIRGLLLTTALVLVCSAAYCAQTLTLNLETPCLGAGSESSSSAAPKSSSAPLPREATVKIARVALVTASSACIYQSKSPSSRLYARVTAQTPLAIVREEGRWFGVLMVNGATGWIASKSVKLIGYDLVAKKSDLNRATAASRGSFVSRGPLANTEIIRTAMQYAGVPYMFGGTSPATGMDCSAFVQSVFGQYGISLPRTAREQAQVGNDVPFDQLAPGDRLYFACKSPYPDHCGIYAGGGYFIHCSARKKGVAVDSLADDFFARSLVAARRS
jgi:cell wall-associated NlpC family hydrolase